MQSAPQFQVVNGQLIGARQVPSPNYNQRPENTEIQLIVIHNISLPPSQLVVVILNSFFKINWIGQSILIFKPSRDAGFAHLLILRTGEIIQFVNFNDRAWHAGRSVIWVKLSVMTIQLD
jgi:AmpD protein